MKMPSNHKCNKNNQLGFKKGIVYSLFSILFLIFNNCASTAHKINLMKPEPDKAAAVIVPVTPSFFHLPVELKLQEIQNQVNKQLNGMIYNDSIIEDDQIKMKVWKQGPILISNENDNIKTVLPLKINVTYRYGFEKLGLKIYDSKDFSLDGIITLKSEVTLDNFSLKTKTEFIDVVWKESPSMVILGKNVPITYLINPGLKLFKSKIEKTIDENIEKTMDFKPHVLKAVEKMAQPTLVNPTFSTWLKIVPQELYSKKSVLEKDVLKIELGMKCLLETIIGSQPINTFESSKLLMKPVSKMPEKITANVVAISTYKEASAVINNNFAGKEFGDGSKKVKVINVDLWHKSGKMIIALMLEGSINGNIYLSGFPQYNQETQEIFFDDLDYVLDTKSFLLKSANWLAQGIILNKIKKQCRYSIARNLEDGKKTIMGFLTNYSPMKGIFVNGNLESLSFETIKLNDQSIMAYLKGSGKVEVTIDGME
ncbi:MAG: DUF4403 family protein [Flavobacterium sp.]